MSMKQPGQLFEIGQAVTLKEPTKWGIVEDAIMGCVQECQGLKFGKVYHVHSYDKFGHWYIKAKEDMKDYYEQNNFVPVLTDEQFCTIYGTIEDQKPVLETAKNGMHAY